MILEIGVYAWCATMLSFAFGLVCMQIVGDTSTRPSEPGLKLWADRLLTLFAYTFHLGLAVSVVCGLIGLISWMVT